ncbi:hypothetical protein [Trinickia acidisoli]|uniref:hypothetical protein n=1 Tax=Trinickia acidisoli TaxID=2767482 RepID=UPI001A8EB3C6|nr:hypothetical protein [Trinickia acidisoli]
MSIEAAAADIVEVERVLESTRHPAFHFMLLTALALVIGGVAHVLPWLLVAVFVLVLAGATRGRGAGSPAAA